MLYFIKYVQSIFWGLKERQQDGSSILRVIEQFKVTRKKRDT